MELPGYYVNPFFVAAVGNVRKSGPSSFSFTVFVSGLAETIKPAFEDQASAEQARDALLTAVGLSRG